ncbi:hypothetical protein J3E68DRAFT_389130 [Trichoderma sp. SZMC 28012]
MMSPPLSGRSKVMDPLDASNRAVAGATATNSRADVRVAPCIACFRVAKCGTSMGLELIRRLHLRTSE